MTSTSNSFAALLGAGGEAAAHAGSKKKKKSKAKPVTSASEVQPPPPPEPAKLAPAAGSKPVAQPPKQPAPVAERKKESARHAASAAALSVPEAIKQLEAAVRGVDAPVLPSLWGQWLTQLAEVSAGRGVRYQAATGELWNFKQVLLTSRALEFSAEAALGAGGFVSEADLGRLFSACFPPSSDFVPETLAEIISRLGQLISPADVAVLRSAQRTVSAAVKVLKGSEEKADGSVDDTAWVPRLEKIDSALSEQENALRKLGQRTTTAAVLKDQANITAELVRLSEEKLDLLRTGGADSGVGSPASAECVSAIASLRSLLQDLMRGSASKGSSLKDTQTLRARHAQLKDEIRSLETSLQRARQELVTVDDLLAAGSGAAMLGKSYDQHLMALDTLDALLQRSSEAKMNSSAGAAAAVRATEAGAPANFLSAIERNLQALYAVQGDLAINLKSTLEKIQRNTRQAQQLSNMNSPAKASVENNRKVRDELERTFSKIQVDDEAVMTSMKQTLARLEQRSEALKKLPGHSSRSSLYREIESQASALRQGHEALQASIASRIDAEQQKRVPRRADFSASTESDDAKRLREVEEALKAMRAEVQAKDEQLALLTQQPVGPASVEDNEEAPVESRAGRQRQVQPEMGIPQDQNVQPHIGTISSSMMPPMASATLPASVPPAAHAPQMIGANMADPVVVAPSQQSQHSAPIQPKAAPRGWGKVDTAPVIMDDSLPSLADAMAEAAKGKRGARK